jgi:hypothetical protein
VDGFLAPEILDGGTPSLISDLYSVGAVMFFIAFFDFKQFTETQNVDCMLDSFKIDREKIED